MTPADERIDRWIDALLQRHLRHLTRPELLRAIRALSVRYVERRHTLSARSPADTAGKRAAFAAFYAPLHLLTTQAIVRALGSDACGVETILDLGCGTGVVSAAWSLACRSRPRVVGVDRHRWALDEARWNWNELGVEGRLSHRDLVEAAARSPGPRTAHALGWTVNELAPAARDRLLMALLASHAGGGIVLVIEPIARSITPWWPAWSEAFARVGGRGRDWSFDRSLPHVLAALGREAGFDYSRLTARTLWLGPVDPSA